MRYDRYSFRPLMNSFSIKRYAAGIKYSNFTERSQDISYLRCRL